MFAQRRHRAVDPAAHVNLPGDARRLALLHLSLTRYIAAMERRDYAEAHRRALEIYRATGWSPGDVLEADALRRRIHERLIALARGAGARGLRVSVEAHFAIPSVEALLLSLAPRLSKLDGSGEIYAERSRAGVRWQGREETLYGEPVEMLVIDVEYRQEPGALPRVGVGLEVATRFEKADIAFADAEALEPREGFELLRRHDPEAYSEVLAKTDGGASSPLFLVSRNPAYHNADYAVELPDGRILAVVLPGNSYEYVSAWLFRRGVAVRSGLVDKINGAVGERVLQLDRIYHVYPAELDAGAPGDSVVHASGYVELEVAGPEDEAKVADLLARIIRGLEEAGMV